MAQAAIATNCCRVGDLVVLWLECLLALGPSCTLLQHKPLGEASCLLSLHTGLQQVQRLTGGGRILCWPVARARAPVQLRVSDVAGHVRHLAVDLPSLRPVVPQYLT